MKINKNNVAGYLKNYDFTALFINELGWDNIQTSSLHIKLKEEDDLTYQFSPIAHKRGMIAFLYEDTNKQFPDRSTRYRLERKVAKSAHEHIIIFLNQNTKQQVWQWARTEAGKPSACREHSVYEEHSGEALIQKLEQIAFSLEEEENLTLVEVAGRIRAGFDLERVTKKFYDRFKKEHDKFLDFIEGIPDEGDEKWYASIMLNRLMFTYFIQKQGFLDGDLNYLRNRLEKIELQENDKFFSFYRNFLKKLFHEGLDKDKSDRSAETNQLIGEIPYLNGGIFQIHELEENYLHIEIKDEAFKKIFDFFDEYHWHLDERPLRDDNEINPDVLGYIFEKYINQKQMGAYYTKEDITGYISRNTVIPRLFDMAKEKCRIAFEGKHTVWNLLHEDPDRYIYPAVRHGVSYDIHEKKELEKALELPENIKIGLDINAPKLIERRKDWNKKANRELALPTEIWREVIARRQRYEEIWLKLAAGEITDINDLITYNLDICQFGQDVIESSEGPELIRAFYRSIEKITILDPTCGSGAFLFAALNILEPLYEACLDRMELFLNDLEQTSEKHRSDKYSDFKSILEEVIKHPSRRYFIYKTIILNNLFGVDIMDEAVEICKLRLFLKLMAQVECDKSKPNMGVEALPDVDFNIKAGNSLVGFANYDEVKEAVEGKKEGQGLFDLDGAMPKIDEKAEIVDHAFKLFREMQTQHNISSSEFTTAKQELRNRLSELENELNTYLAKQYGVDPGKLEYNNWLQSHNPFHWYIDFYGIVHGSGGFDVIIGNPPYLEYSKIRNDYTILEKSFYSYNCANLFAFVIEKSENLIKRNDGFLGLIVPLTAIHTNKMIPLQDLFKTHTTFLASFCGDTNPSVLFTGARMQLLISILKKNYLPLINMTNYIRFYGKEREYLFNTKINYFNFNSSAFDLEGTIPKVVNRIGENIITKIINKSTNTTLIDNCNSNGHYEGFYLNSLSYFARAFNYPPIFRNEKIGEGISSHCKKLKFNTEEKRNAIIAILCSSLFYFYWQAFSYGRQLNRREVERFPIDLSSIDPDLLINLSKYSMDLMKDFENHCEIRKTINQKTGISEQQVFYPKKSKSYMDKIDCTLSEGIGFTEEELDYIINYDIKYRMGKELEVTK